MTETAAEDDAGVSRRTLLMSSISVGLAGCSSRTSTSSKTETPTSTEISKTETPTETPTSDDDRVPFSEVDRIDDFVAGVEDFGTTVHDATRMAGGVSIQYERQVPAFDLRSVAVNWYIYYGDVTGYTVLSATAIDTDGSRHGVFSLNEEQTQAFKDSVVEHWFGDVLSNYEARWADAAE